MDIIVAILLISAIAALLTGLGFTFVPLLSEGRRRQESLESRVVDEVVAQLGVPLLFLGAFLLVAGLLAMLFSE